MPFNFTAPGQEAADIVSRGASQIGEFLGQSALQNQQSKLTLQMLSRRIELEQQARMQTIQQQQQMQLLPPDEMGHLQDLYSGLQKSMQSGTSPEFDLSQFTTQPGQAAATRLLDIYATHAMGMSKTEAYQTPWYSDVTGQRIGYKSFNQMGKPLSQKQDPGAADKEKQGIALLNGMNSLDQLTNAEKNIDFGRISGLGSTASAALGMDDGNMTRFKAYKTLVSSMATPLVTGSHRFAPAEQAQLQQMLGTAFNTPQEVKSAADAIRNIYNQGAATLGLGEDPSWTAKHASRLAGMFGSAPLGSAPNPAQAIQQQQQTPFSDDAFNAALNSYRSSKKAPGAKPSAQ